MDARQDPVLWAVAAVIPGSKTIELLESNAGAADLDLVSQSHPAAVAR